MRESSAPAAILVIGGAGTPLADVAARDPSVELVGDIDEVETRLGRRDGSVRLVVLTPATTRPLSVARRVRVVDRRVGLAFVVPAADADATRDRLAFAPELSGTVVVGEAGDVSALAAELRTAAERSAQRRQLRSALDEINRGLSTPDTSAAPAPPRSVSERYLAALTRHLPEGVVSVDGHGRVVTLNPSASAVLGVSTDEAEGRPFSELLASEDGEAVQALLRQAGGGSTAEHDDLPFRRPGGDRGLVSLTAAPVTDDRGHVAGIVLLVRDVTDERRTAERLRELQKAESLATLAGGVAHDFNNLLVSVQSWAGIAAEDITDGEMVATALDHIERAARRAAELARSMLAYAGRGTFELEPTDLNEIVREMSSLLKAAISRKTTVSLALAEPLPAVLADATQVRQVVMNLVTNAAEAIGGGAGTIDLRTSLRELAADEVGEPAEGGALPSGTYAVIEVADTGVGMDDATLARIFDPFFTTKFTGRGLGLAASHGIVRAHGGDIEVESRRGHGTVFRVLFPLDEGER